MDQIIASIIILILVIGGVLFAIGFIRGVYLAFKRNWIAALVFMIIMPQFFIIWVFIEAIFEDLLKQKIKDD